MSAGSKNSTAEAAVPKVFPTGPPRRSRGGASAQEKDIEEINLDRWSQLDQNQQELGRSQKKLSDTLDQSQKNLSDAHERLTETNVRLQETLIALSAKLERESAEGRNRVAATDATLRQTNDTVLEILSSASVVSERVDTLDTGLGELRGMISPISDVITRHTAELAYLRNLADAHGKEFKATTEFKAVSEAQRKELLAEMQAMKEGVDDLPGLRHEIEKLEEGRVKGVDKHNLLATTVMRTMDDVSELDKRLGHGRAPTESMARGDIPEVWSQCFEQADRRIGALEAGEEELRKQLSIEKLGDKLREFFVSVDAHQRISVELRTLQQRFAGAHEFNKGHNAEFTHRLELVDNRLIGLDHVVGQHTQKLDRREFSSGGEGALAQVRSQLAHGSSAAQREQMAHDDMGSRRESPRDDDLSDRFSRQGLEDYEAIGFSVEEERTQLLEELAQSWEKLAGVVRAIRRKDSLCKDSLFNQIFHNHTFPIEPETLWRDVQGDMDYLVTEFLRTVQYVEKYFVEPTMPPLHASTELRALVHNLDLFMAACRRVHEYLTVTEWPKDPSQNPGPTTFTVQMLEASHRSLRWFEGKGLTRFRAPMAREEPIHMATEPPRFIEPRPFAGASGRLARPHESPGQESISMRKPRRKPRVTRHAHSESVFAIQDSSSDSDDTPELEKMTARSGSAGGAAHSTSVHEGRSPTVPPKLTAFDSRSQYDVDKHRPDMQKKADGSMSAAIQVARVEGMPPRTFRFEHGADSPSPERRPQHSGVSPPSVPSRSLIDGGAEERSYVGRDLRRVTLSDETPPVLSVASRLPKESEVLAVMAKIRPMGPPSMLDTPLYLDMVEKYLAKYPGLQIDAATLLEVGDWAILHTRASFVVKMKALSSEEMRLSSTAALIKYVRTVLFPTSQIEYFNVLTDVAYRNQRTGDHNLDHVSADRSPLYLQSNKLAEEIQAMIVRLPPTHQPPLAGLGHGQDRLGEGFVDFFCNTWAELTGCSSILFQIRAALTLPTATKYHTFAEFIEAFQTELNKTHIAPHVKQSNRKKTLTATLAQAPGTPLYTPPAVQAPTPATTVSSAARTKDLKVQMFAATLEDELVEVHSTSDNQDERHWLRQQITALQCDATRSARSVEVAQERHHQEALHSHKLQQQLDLNRSRTEAQQVTIAELQRGYDWAQDSQEVPSLAISNRLEEMPEADFSALLVLAAARSEEQDAHFTLMEQKGFARLPKNQSACMAFAEYYVCARGEHCLYSHDDNICEQHVREKLGLLAQNLKEREAARSSAVTTGPAISPTSILRRTANPAHTEPTAADDPTAGRGVPANAQYNTQFRGTPPGRGAGRYGRGSSYVNGDARYPPQGGGGAAGSYGGRGGRGDSY
jgi:hypothetical protein